MVTGSGGDSSRDESVKHLFDRIGKKVYEKTEKIAKLYTTELHGDLSNVTYPKDRNSTDSTPSNPCLLKYDYNTNVTDGYEKEYPCKDRPEVRFSDEYGGQCTDTKIKGNEDNKGGACAPFRRLFLCDHHLSYMNADKTNTTDNLLLEVCLAALYEGVLISADHARYKGTNPDSQLCTVLARSFADIGDIVRGKDLFRGYNQKDRNEKKQLQDNLKDIFKKIHDNLKDKEAEKHYKGDTDKNYYKLREYWWYANRETVWKAITCDADGSYFHATCSERNGGCSQANHKCRCPNGNDQVPTYFDYVPQYLRWFEEWAEDFCRKRKHKLQNAITNCRYPKGEDKYCDLNGYDCTQTAKKENKLFPDSNCNKCSVACNPFVDWIENKKKEFEKQKKKYGNEIKESNENTEKETKHGPINNLYVKNFYDILKEQYGTVENFLQLLSNEKICQSQPQVKQEKADAANFTKGNVDKTFYRTKYCRACPLCGVEGKEGNWTDKEESECEKKEENKIYHLGNTTEIPKLPTDKGKTGILQKYRTFCDSVKNTANGATGEKSVIDGDQIKKWTCHYEDTKRNNCILGDWKTSENVHYPISYYSFFYGSFTEMLKDSVEWRERLNNCINNKTGKCKNEKCKEYCECFKSWIGEKKKELDGIKEHFGKQEDIQKEIDRDMIFNITLKDNFLQDMKNAHGDEKAIKRIEELVEKKNIDVDNPLDKKTIIEYMFEDDSEEIDEKCKKIQKDCEEKKKQQQEREDLARSLPTPEDRSQPRPAPPASVKHDEDGNHSDEDSEDEEEGDEDVGEESEEPAAEGTDGEGEPVVPSATEKSVEVCETVKKALDDTASLNAACSLKYVTGKNYGWRCVAPSGPTSGGSEPTTSSDNKGGLCIPPRRRRLYVTPLTKLTSDNTETSQGGEKSSQPGGSEASSPGGTSSQPDPLLKAFIESAAVETFFLWHKYKEEKKKEIAEKKKRQQENGGLDLDGLSGDDDDEDPQKKLEESGKIPDGFLRQMFYTLGDYRDICVGNTPSGIDEVITSDQKEKEASSKVTMKQISDKIQKTLNGDNKDTAVPPLPKPGVTTPQALWDKIAPSIWNGMICALTYKENEVKNPDGKTTYKIVKDTTANYDELIDKKTGKPKGKYGDYKTVKLENSETQAKDTQPSPSGEKTTLVDFISRPTYFRYLEEWGETFCGTRKRMLKDVRDNCRPGIYGDKTCSGDGFECKTESTKKEDIFKHFDCPSCARHCRFYKKWIERKKDEFTKQKDRYQTESNSAKSNNDYSGFHATLQKFTTAAEFLKRLKDGPCKKDNDSEEDNEINFQASTTFEHTQKCDPCSEFTVKCNGDGCRGGANGNKCPGGKISPKNIDEKTDGNGNIEMLVSDNSKSGFKNGLETCGSANIFKGIRKEQWNCYKVCGVDICTLEKKNNNGQETGKKYIIMKELLKRWLEYFFEDYNRIQKKLKPCTNSGKGSTCIKKCVDEWIKLKKGEWEKINDKYLDQNTKVNPDGNNLKTFLETLIPQMDLVNDKGKITKLSQFDNSCGCSADASAQKNDDHKDAIECMLDKLGEKATSCQTQHQPSGETEKSCADEPPLEDEEEEDYENENTEEAKKMVPTICEGVLPKTKKVVEEDACKAAPTAADSEQTNPEQTPILKPEDEPQEDEDNDKKVEEKKSEEKSVTPPSIPSLPPSTQPSDNTSDIVAKTLPFGIALALGSIAFLFLK
ncbi:hypothetical protein PFMALIP_05786, partial [Plasmodium falciparum MaliPS096_E11]